MPTCGIPGSPIARLDGNVNGVFFGDSITDGQLDPGNAIAGATIPSGNTVTICGLAPTLTQTAAPFTQPASGANVNIQIGDTSWMYPTLKFFIGTGGGYEVVSVIDGTNVTVKNLGLATLNGFRLPVAYQIAYDQHVGDLPSTLNISWLGPQTSGDPPTNNHDGIPGSTTTSHLATIPTTYGPGNPIPSVDFFIVLIGINNAADATGTNAFLTNYATMIQLLSSTSGAKRFMVSLIRPAGPDPHVENAMIINAALPSIWNALQAGDPTLIFRRASENIAGLPIHPTTIADFLQISASWYPAIRSLLGYPM